MRSAILKSVLSVALCSIVAMLAMPASLSAKERNGNSAKAEANIEDCYWYKRFGELKSKVFNNGLRLLDFEYVDKITTEKQKDDFVKQCLNDNAHMMYCPNSRYLRYEISTIKQIKAKAPSIYKYFKEHLIRRVERIKPNDTVIVKLKWEYNSKQFETFATVTDSRLNWTGGEGTIANKRNLEYLIFENMLLPLQIDECSVVEGGMGGVMATLPYIPLS